MTGPVLVLLLAAGTFSLLNLVARRSSSELAPGPPPAQDRESTPSSAEVTNPTEEQTDDVDDRDAALARRLPGKRHRRMPRNHPSLAKSGITSPGLTEATVAAPVEPARSPVAVAAVEPGRPAVAVLVPAPVRRPAPSESERKRLKALLEQMQAMRRATDELTDQVAAIVSEMGTTVTMEQITSLSEELRQIREIRKDLQGEIEKGMRELERNRSGKTVQPRGRW